MHVLGLASPLALALFARSFVTGLGTVYAVVNPSSLTYLVVSTTNIPFAFPLSILEVFQKVRLFSIRCSGSEFSPARGSKKRGRGMQNISALDKTHHFTDFFGKLVARHPVICQLVSRRNSERIAIFFPSVHDAHAMGYRMCSDSHTSNIT